MLRMVEEWLRNGNVASPKRDFAGPPRMMQKALPGQLFFGEDTNRILPPSLKVKEAAPRLASHSQRLGGSPLKDSKQQGFAKE